MNRRITPKCVRPETGEPHPHAHVFMRGSIPYYPRMLVVGLRRAHRLPLCACSVASAMRKPIDLASRRRKKEAHQQRSPRPDQAERDDEGPPAGVRVGEVVAFPGAGALGGEMARRGLRRWSSQVEGHAGSDAGGGSIARMMSAGAFIALA